MLLYVLPCLLVLDALGIVGVALEAPAGGVVLRAGGHKTALCHGNGRVVRRLAEVGRYHVLHAVFHRSSSPSNLYSSRASSRAPSIISCVKSWTSVSRNSQPYSCAYHHAGMLLRSASRNAGGILGHWLAGIS